MNIPKEIPGVKVIKNFHVVVNGKLKIGDYVFASKWSDGHKEALMQF